MAMDNISAFGAFCLLIKNISSRTANQLTENFHRLTIKAFSTGSMIRSFITTFRRNGLT